ncbi:unnamed protein product [Rhodiola kirilowii]
MPMIFFRILVQLGFLLITRCYGESSTCLMLYKEGGAPAVYQSPKCPRWKLSNYDDSWPSQAPVCQTALHQGRRKNQEDRIICNLDVQIPFPGESGVKDVMVGVVAVFDGHNGAEASDMASKLLLEYFLLHTYFLLDSTYSVMFGKSMLPNKEYHANADESANDRDKSPLLPIFDESFRLKILKESLLRAIHDIDTAFSREASKRTLDSGTTATVILLADDQILAANIGDSKALLCSEKVQSPADAKARLLRIYAQKRRRGLISRFKGHNGFEVMTSKGLAHLFVKELTRDHHPDRDDEKSRVETAGGYVYDSTGAPRVNGKLAVSRAIGDVSLKRYGVISSPEITDWQQLTDNDSYLVVASDGLFESLSTQDVCDLLWETEKHDNAQSQLSTLCSYALADCLVKTAFDQGSRDNIATAVVPLRAPICSSKSAEEKCGISVKESSTINTYPLVSKQPLVSVSSEIAQLEQPTHPVLTKFNRLLVEGKHGAAGCFYVFENLTHEVDYMIRPEMPDWESDPSYPSQALPQTLDDKCGWHVDLYGDTNYFSHFGGASKGANNQCINPEALARFIGLLESVPFHDTSSGDGLFDFTMPDLRYTLKKRFDRGSYGEVWLAFYWNCSKGKGPVGGNQNGSVNDINDDTFKKNSETADLLDSNLLILKRILVERGPAVYLSGLREKHFGELFLNASSHLEDNIWSSKDFTLIDSVAYAEQGLDHIARYIESFESRANEIWLVFRHEGISLSKLMYTVEDFENISDEGDKANRVRILHPSKWWHWLKKTEAGQNEMRNLIRQLLLAIKSCHDRNITHRDIKPENMVICFEDEETGRCLKGSPSGNQKFITKMRLIDFGSAIDEFTLKRLYGAAGPSRAEQTSEYMPPEALLNATWYQAPKSVVLKYDMWSVGVVMLEMILGSNNVFQINAITRNRLDPYLDGWSDDLKELAYKLRSLMELCILTPGTSSKNIKDGRTNRQGGVLPASWKCSEEFFSNYVKIRDPLSLGFPNILAMRLVRQLLNWDPEDRLTVDEALKHPYFHHD